MLPLAPVAFVVCFLLVAVIAWMAIATEGRTWRKTVATLALLALIPAGYVTVTELLGRPKPAGTAFLESFTGYRKVIAYDIHENRAIFLWFDMGGAGEPRVFAFPYDRQTVSELQEAAERAEGLASELMARLEQDERGQSRTKLEFTSEVDIRRELPGKPDEEPDEDVMVLEPGDGNTFEPHPHPGPDDGKP
ncbi:MAG: hypothetical protein GDA49_05960 [Rhodospirillales bacterium]|nr:hypothetical protein [Rhodospirillales bacterium]